MLATASGDGEVTLWDVPTGKSLKTLGSNDGFGNSIAFSPDGKTLVSTGWDGKVIVGDGNQKMSGQIRLWDVATGVNTLTIPGNRGAMSVAFSPNGKTIASSPYGYINEHSEEINLWDAVTGKEVLSIQPPHILDQSNSNRSLAFSPDSKTLAAISPGRTVRLWDLATGKNVKTLEGAKAPTESGCSIISVAFGRDGKTVLASCGRGVVMWDADSGKVIRTLEAGWTPGMALSPDGKTIATASGGDGFSSRPSTIKLWDVATGKNTTTFSGNAGWPAYLAFSPDGKVLAAGTLVNDGGVVGSLGRIGFWDLQSAK
jgi:WD40 repeat protein